MSTHDEPPQWLIEMEARGELIKRPFGWEPPPITLDDIADFAAP